MSTEARARSKSPYKITVTDDENTNQTIRDLIKKRAIVKGRLTRFTNYINSFSSDILSAQSRADLKLRTKGATSLFTEFSDIQTKLEEYVLEVDLEEQLQQRDLFEDCYYSTLARVECMLSDDEAPTCSKRCNSDSVKLPTISVPTFDGSSEHWLEFRDTFLSLVHNSPQISSIQKYHYLKSSLKGSAALVIHSLEFCANNYTVAWELLLNRYNNSRLLIQNHVRALFNVQSLTRESPDLLRNLIDTILKNLRALKLLGEPVDSWDTLIIYIIVSKLDKTTERAWELFKSNTSRQSDDSESRLRVDTMLSFLKDRADMLETLQVSHSDTKMNNNKHNTITHTGNKVHCNVSTNKPQQSKKHCLLCNDNHPLYACQTFLSYTLDSRIKCVKDNKLCENCLRAGHTVTQCRFGPCRKCDKKHNSLIHTDSVASQRNERLGLASGDNSKPALAMQASLASQLPREDSALTHTNASCIQYPCMQPVLLSTALVEVKDNSNVFHLARALLDSGSERCIITQSLCDKLKCNKIQSTQEIRGVGNSISQSTQICDIEVKSRTNSFTMRMQCFVLEHITSTMPVVPKQHAQFRMPAHIQLADPYFNECQPIDILIGADKFWDLLCEGKMRLPNGPFVQNTQLGWIISGPVHINTRSTGHIQCNFSQAIDEQLRKFWELEELPKPSDTRTEEEKACEEHFVRTTKRNSDGRFVVSIPLKSSPDDLGETYRQAQNQFFSLEKRLDRMPDYKKLYTDFIHEYEKLGHMTRIDTYGTPNFFMPHHGVFREHSTTTKLRVVFNASATSSSGKSLNDLQLVGSAIQGDLLGILLRMRQHRYIACADVEKMYRQVLVSEDQRDLHLILWRNEPNEPLGIYRLNTVVYGTASAPFLAVRCLKELGIQCSNPDVKRVIAEDIFVDDMITGADDKAHLIKLCEATYEVLNSGCFPLRKWIFNFECDRLSTKILSGDKQLNLDENSQCKTLGICWNYATDEFTYKTQFKPNAKITKRTILSHVSQIFDPFGLLSPCITLAKVLLQKLWLIKIDWDTELPSDVTATWNRFVTSLSTLDSIRVPRHVMGIEPVITELHIFSDASQTAYGACAYVRTVDGSNIVTVKLLIAKGKTAPLKPISIPRLELCGALVAARLYTKICESLHCRFNTVTFWTDSTIVLGWLRMAPNLLKTFVQNRVAEIHELTKELAWRHVRGIENPADLVSRGVPLHDLASSTLWWEGPPFLREFQGDCAELISGMDPETSGDLPEIKSSAVHALHSQPIDNVKFPFSRFSQFDRMRRTFAYVRRFIHNARNLKINRRYGELDVDELRESELCLARIAQSESFPNEYNCILNNKSLKLNRSLSKLNLFIDNKNIIRVGGRLENASNFSYDKKHPILLCAHHTFTALLFQHEHKRLFHAAPQALLYDVRQQWWPVGGRNLARKTVHECIPCKRLKGKPLAPLMGNLPAQRLNPTYPFLYCGVDYAGPMLMLNRKGRGAQTVKVYVALFICFLTRAIHLELVSDLSSEAYILALKRFISRRGKPSEIFSDNGRNFVGAMKEFSKYLLNCSADISEYATGQSIKFKFIPAYSPHFGGLWEAGVKSSKYHLLRTMGTARLTFEEFTTVLTQVEAILNSRPLSPLSSNPDDLLPLSPGHFLVGRSLTAPVYQDMRHNDTGACSIDRYKRVEQLRHHFWARWAKEYVSEMQTRSKWQEDTYDHLKPNTMVVIKDDNLPPLKWHLGRVVKTVPGKDGICRVADIMTSSGIVRRAYTKICPLLNGDK